MRFVEAFSLQVLDGGGEMNEAKVRALFTLSISNGRFPVNFFLQTGQKNLVGDFTSKKSTLCMFVVSKITDGKYIFPFKVIFLLFCIFLFDDVIVHIVDFQISKFIW